MEKTKQITKLKIPLNLAIIIISIAIILIGIIGYSVYISIVRSNYISMEIDNNIEDSSEIIENAKYMNLSINPSVKPIIYLYPVEDMEVSVTLEKSDLITHSYPKYISGWNVLAKTNGELLDIDTGKKLYALYYENTNSINFKVEEDGFIVAGEDTTEFLEEKLAILGLTEREAEEFIIYWLPILEENNYNYIRFATMEEINENMPIEINPNPDTIIRILMTYKGLESPIEVQEQQLETPDRTGFVAVEWGGTEIE